MPDRIRYLDQMLSTNWIELVVAYKEFIAPFKDDNVTTKKVKIRNASLEI